MKIFSLLLLLVLTGTGVLAQNASGFPLNPRVERKIDSLLALMTLEEKVGQMNQYSSTWELTGPLPTDGSNQKRLEQIRSGMVGSMLNVTGAEATRKAQELALQSRLKIPLLFGYDVIHGYKTIFPIPLGETASWDVTAVTKAAEVAAREAAAAGLHWTFAPMMDLSRDPRWGRVMEGSGEDPYLGAVMAVARVKGFQGNNLAADHTIAACAKHYAGYGFAEGGRDYNTVDLSEHTLQNMILPPFKAAVAAGVASVMNSFNEIGGVPATASTYLQRQVLKGDWGFNGMVVSDWGSIGELVPHGVAANLSEAAHLAVRAGSDMDMESQAYINHLSALVKNGVVPLAQVNDAVRRILRLKFSLGLFDDPFRYSDVAREKARTLTSEHLALAREVGRKSIVLLKNEGNRLPLSKKVRSIAVIGTLATDKDSPLGSWRGQGGNDNAVSVLEGIRTAADPATAVTFSPGYKLAISERSFMREVQYDANDRSGFKDAIAAAKKAEVVVFVLGEDCYQTGEGRSQADITLKGLQEELLREVAKVNPNVVAVLMNGRPLVLTGIAATVPAILETWHLGSASGHAIADVLFGDYNPSGKLPISFPRHQGQIPLAYNHKNTGRPSTAPGLVFWSHYTDMPNDPLYPFGFGLSYASFKYSNLQLSRTAMGPNTPIVAQVTLTNTSSRAGTETVQWYIQDLVGSVTRPVKELKGFEQVTLQPGESRTLSFTITPSALEYFSGQNRWEAEPGAFKVFVGGNSRDVMEAKFELQP